MTAAPEIPETQEIKVRVTGLNKGFDGDPVLPEGMSLGDQVIVLADEYGSGSVSGTLAASGLHEIAVRRQTERAGEVVVHFPREDYSLIKLG